MVEYSNNRKHIIIICKKHGEFTQIPFVHLLGHGCPSCINKTEFKFYEKIKEIYPTIKRQYKVYWCKNKLRLPYDFVIEELNIIIEIDGEQHFTQISNWTSPEIQIEKDKYKMKCANENGFSVIRLPQVDISKDSYDWFNEIQLSIEKIRNINVLFFNSADELISMDKKIINFNPQTNAVIDKTNSENILPELLSIWSKYTGKNDYCSKSVENILGWRWNRFTKLLSKKRGSGCFNDYR